jgi:hypothetical protein
MEDAQPAIGFQGANTSTGEALEQGCVLSSHAGAGPGTPLDANPWHTLHMHVHSSAALTGQQII